MPQQPTALSTAANFFTRVAKIVEGPATAVEKWGKAASEVVCEVSETLRVIDELVEYHGGEDQGADIYVLALGYLEQKPDAELEDRLRWIIRQYGDQLELRRLKKLLHRHKHRVSRTGPSERVERINSAFRHYGSYQEALRTLANYYTEDKSAVLIDTIRDAVCSEGAYLLLDEDIIREVGNRIRREATAKRRALEAEKRLLADSGSVSGSKLGVRRPRDPRNIEQDSFDTLNYLEQLAKNASESRATRPTAQELESFALSAYMADKEAEEKVKRSANQIKQERHRAVKKLRRASGL